MHAHGREEQDRRYKPVGVCARSARMGRGRALRFREIPTHGWRICQSGNDGGELSGGVAGEVDDGWETGGQRRVGREHYVERVFGAG